MTKTGSYRERSRPAAALGADRGLACTCESPCPRDGPCESCRDCPNTPYTDLPRWAHNPDCSMSANLSPGMARAFISPVSTTRILRRSGDLANAAEPVVADHIVTHGWLDMYLLWFDDQLAPHLAPNKTTEAELAMAKWGIGGEDFWLRDGGIWSGDQRCFISDGRTAVAVDFARKRLFLAVGTHISPNLMFQTLADLGAGTGCFWMAATRARWPLAPAPAWFHLASCMVGDRLQTKPVCG